MRLSFATGGERRFFSGRSPSGVPMILAAVVAIAIPMVFLYLVRWLDLYASGSFKTVIVCFAAGLAAFFIALPLNSYLAVFVGYALAVVLVAPIVEELLKSLTLIYYVRRPEFTYFVDGAIYGFAAGTAFAVIENIFFLINTTQETGILLALSRGFSTSLMHGSTSAMVGVSLGRLRFGRGRARLASLILGWAAAVVLHIAFNYMVQRSENIVGMVIAILIGLIGVGMTVGFILWGLHQEKRWLRESLQLDVGVSKHESAVVQRMEDLDALLAPVGQRFGKEKQQQVTEFLKLQAKLGLKHKAQSMIQDEKLKARLMEEVGEIRAQIDKLRRQVGLYCMSYVRSILPPEATSVFALVAQKDLDRDAMEQGGVFALTTDRLQARLSQAQKKRDTQQATDGRA